MSTAKKFWERAEYAKWKKKHDILRFEKLSRREFKIYVRRRNFKIKLYEKEVEQFSERRLETRRVEILKFKIE